MMNMDATIPSVDNEKVLTGSNGNLDRMNAIQQQHQTLLASLPENRFELELEFIQALSSPAYIHFLATSRSLDDSAAVSSSSPSSSVASQSTFQQLQPFLHYLYNTYSQPEYARFLRYPHALYFLESLLIYDDNSDNHKSNRPENATESTPKTSSANVAASDAVSTGGTSTGTNKLWVEWTVPSYRNFCHQQQFLAWQHRHSTCYGVGSVNNNSNDHIPDDTNHHQEEPVTAAMDENDDDMDDEDDKQE
jgi:mediator of RNA polymerase II transcription subunit 31